MKTLLVREIASVGTTHFFLHKFHAREMRLHRLQMPKETTLTLQARAEVNKAMGKLHSADSKHPTKEWYMGHFNKCFQKVPSELDETWCVRNTHGFEARPSYGFTFLSFCTCILNLSMQLLHNDLLQINEP